MRRWHHFLAPFFALFLLIIAVTGTAIQVTDLADHQSKPKLEMARPAICAPAKPQRTPIGKWNHWLKDIHSGAEFGPVGTAISIASSLGLLFFAVSGFWMYLSMWLRRRKARIR